MSSRTLTSSCHLPCANTSPSNHTLQSRQNAVIAKVHVVKIEMISVPPYFFKGNFRSSVIAGERVEECCAQWCEQECCRFGIAVYLGFELFDKAVATHAHQVSGHQALVVIAEKVGWRTVRLPPEGLLNTFLLANPELRWHDTTLMEDTHQQTEADIEDDPDTYPDVAHASWYTDTGQDQRDCW